MASPSSDWSLYYLLSAGIPMLACALLGRFVSWWLAAGVWEAGAMFFFLWKRPMQKGRGFWQNFVILLATAAFGIGALVGKALERVFPRIVEL